MSEHNYVEMTGRLHRWDVRQTRTGAMARGWIEVRRNDAEGTTKFPLISWDPDPAWEEHVDNVIALSGHLVWSREMDSDGAERYVVLVHVDAMRFIRAARNGHKNGARNGGARNGKTYKPSKPAAPQRAAQVTETSGENEDNLPF